MSPKGDFSCLDGLSFHARFILNLSIAFISCGRLLRGDFSLSGIDDSGEKFQFGDFSKLVSLVRRLEVVASLIEATDSMCKFSRDQESALRMQGVDPQAYRRFSEIAWGLDINEMSEFDASLNVEELRSELIKEFLSRNAVYTLLNESSARNGDPSGVFVSFLNEPWHLLSPASSCNRKAKIVAGLSIKIEEKRKPSQRDEMDSLFYMDYDQRRRRDDRKFRINLAVELSIRELIDYGFAQLQERHLRYDLESDEFIVREEALLNDRVVEHKVIQKTPEPSDSTTEEISRVIALAVQSGKTLEDQTRNNLLQELGRCWKLRFEKTGHRFRRTNELMQTLQEIFSRRLSGAVNFRNEDFARLMPETLDPREIALAHIDKGTEPSEEEFSESVLFNGEELRSFFSEMSRYVNSFPERQRVLTSRLSVLISPCGNVQKPGYWGDGRYLIRQTFPGDLLIDIDKGIVVFAPEKISEAQLAVVNRIEADEKLSPNFFGLNKNMNEKTGEDIEKARELIRKYQWPLGIAERISLDERLCSESFNEDLFTGGVLLSSDAGAILSITSRQATSGVWSRKIASLSLGNLLLKAFNDKGKLVLLSIVER
ncbi:MAG TPA: hypothetical protein PJ989_02850 [Oligoflexia bacterium]|nr:hypothetical protein [Oligoflexia bacterium]